MLLYDCLEQLVDFMHEFAEFSLKNVTFKPDAFDDPEGKGGRLSPSKLLNSTQFEPISAPPSSLLKNIERICCRIMKLHLSKISLGYSDQAIGSLSKFILTSGTTCYYTLSWCNLQPHHLHTLIISILKSPANIRQLDLSYNQLSFDNKANKDGSKLQQPSVEYSCKFVQELIGYLNSTESDMMNHVNLAGMRFEDDHLRALCTELAQKPNLLNVHLDDNGINRIGADGSLA